MAATCSTEPLLDGSGVKILCGGDSIGVVLNGAKGEPGEKGDKGDTGAQGIQGKQGVAGKDGTDGRDGVDGVNGRDGNDGKDGAGCSMETIDELSVRVTCGTESTVLYVGELPDTTGQGEVVLDSEKIAISLDEVSGVTQKGPFLMGSKVLVREMEDGRTLTQTGNSFNGKILNDNGEFKINARMLVSQYVMLEATGYYRNEVTGENSNSELTLFAITDVNDRNIVNVNLLTHLEYERVIYLVTQKKMKVRAAKKQAQKEVFGLLNIDATNFSNSEDLNIAGASDEDAALLAFSIILQGDRSVSQLSELLQKIATDMETDGVWDDEARRSELADFAAAIDSSDRIQRIRTNVEGWGLSSIVPNFEKHVRKFWTTEFGMGECNDENIGKVVAANKGIATRRYICRADSLWHVASDFEKDTYQWKDSTDGALKAGTITGKTYVFDSTGVHNGGVKGWRDAAYLEGLYGGCNKKLYGVFRYDNKQGGYYQCQEQSHDWVLVNNNVIIDTQLWSEGEDGYAKWGDSIGVVTPGRKICYVYDTSAVYNGWREGTNDDCTLGLLGCTDGRAGRMLKSPESGDYYNCANKTWTKVTERVKYNTMGWDCLDSNDGEMKIGLVNDAYFVCEDNSWREASTSEELNCRDSGDCVVYKCTKKKQGLFKKINDETKVCDCGEWRTPNCAEIATGSLCTANDSALVEACEKMGAFDIDYVCSASQWHAVKTPFEYTLAQWTAKRNAYNAAAVDAALNSDSMITDPRDGNTYRTVVINGMRVFAENLRYADSVTSVNLKGQTWCFNKEAKNCEIGGREYKWTAAMDIDSKWYWAVAKSLINVPHQGICPNGWHVPTSDEWSSLLSGVDFKALKMPGFSSWDGSNYSESGYWNDATDSSGFSALPNRDGCNSIGEYCAHFWTATEYSYKYADHIYLPYEPHADGKSAKRAVRCLQDYSTEP